MEDLSVKAKSFWARPEGTTGMLTIAGVGVGLFFALPTLLAFMGGLVALLGQTIFAMCLAGVIGLMLFIVTNKRIQTLVSYMFKSVMRGITKMFVEIDPIGIMKSYIEELIKKREVMEVSRDKLNGQMTVLKRQIDQNNASYENSMAKAQIAHEKGNTGVFSVSSRQAGRLEKLNKASLVPLYDQMVVHLRAIKKYHEVTGTVIDDLKNEVDAREIERKMIMASYAAMSAAKRILYDGGQQKELFDQAMEFVVEDFGMKMGEIDSFIENSQGFVEGLDMQNGVYEADALKRLQAWEQKADSILLGNDKARMLEQNNLSSTINVGIGLPAAQSIVDYERLIK